MKIFLISIAAVFLVALMARTALGLISVPDVLLGWVVGVILQELLSGHEGKHGS